MHRGTWIMAALAGAMALPGCSSPLLNKSPTAGQYDDFSYYDAVEDEDDGFQFTDLSPSKLKKSALKIAGRGPNPAVARQLYGEADSLYQQALQLRHQDPQGDQASPLFRQAADQYAAAASRWPDSALEQDALFRAGESHFFADEYPEANEYFERLLKQHPNSKYLDIVQARRFSIAQYWLETDELAHQSFWSVNWTDDSRPWRDTRGNALRVFDRIPLDDPTGKLSDDAMLAAANAHFRLGNYYRADQLYGDLRRTFPSSEHQFLAHFLGVKTKLLSYEGPKYDGDALQGAEKLIQQIRRQFPVEAQENDVMLSRAYREVRYKMAEREWDMARYYHNRREFGAAGFYYEILLNDYSDTPLADRAREQREKIAGKPATPPQRLTWLVNLFPESDPVKPLLHTSPGTKLR